MSVSFLAPSLARTRRPTSPPSVRNDCSGTYTTPSRTGKRHVNGKPGKRLYTNISNEQSDKVCLTSISTLTTLSVSFLAPRPPRTRRPTSSPSVRSTIDACIEAVIQGSSVESQGISR